MAVATEMAGLAVCFCKISPCLPLDVMLGICARFKLSTSSQSLRRISNVERRVTEASVEALGSRFPSCTQRRGTGW